MNLKAQGTIEYLIVVAIVVVIGLVAVSLLASTADTQNLATTTGRIDTQTRSGIVITEAAVDITGDSFLLLRNNDPEEKTLTKITIDGKENVFDQRIARGQEILINLNQINTNCKCEPGETTKTCTYQIEYTSRYGITTTQNLATTITCEENITPAKTPISSQYIFSNTNCFDPNQDPIPICTLEDLNQMRTNLNANYKLMNDIDASPTKQWNNGEGWDPIGKFSPTYDRFSGDFNGNNYSIIELFINRNSDFVGLFGYFEQNSNLSKISNINLIDVNIIGNDNVGGVAGFAAQYMPTQNHIRNSNVTGNITGNDYVGGISGRTSGILLNCKSSANINGNDYVGGITGTNSQTIEKAYFNGNINGNNHIGGITGRNSESLVHKSMFDGDINGNQNVGGIVGFSIGSIRDSFSLGKINGDMNVGGIAGQAGSINTFQTIQNIYSNSTITGNNNVGGLIGFANGFNAYSLFGPLIYKLQNSFSISNINKNPNPDFIPTKDFIVYDQEVFAQNGLDGSNRFFNIGFTALKNFDGNITIFSPSPTGWTQAGVARIGSANPNGSNFVLIQELDKTVGEESITFTNITLTEGQYYYIIHTNGGFRYLNSHSNWSYPSYPLVSEYISVDKSNWEFTGTNHTSGFYGPKKIILTTNKNNINSTIGSYTTAQVNKFYWDSYLSNQINCHTDSNTGCIETNNEMNLYYGINGIPFSELNFNTEIWQANENGLPTLK